MCGIEKRVPDDTHRLRCATEYPPAVCRQYHSRHELGERSCEEPADIGDVVGVPCRFAAGETPRRLAAAPVGRSEARQAWTGLDCTRFQGSRCFDPSPMPDTDVSWR